MIIFFIITLLILNTLSYFDIIKNTKIFKLIIPCITVLIGSYKFGKLNKFRGYLSGFYLGLSFIIFTLIINLLFYQSFSLKLLIYYLIITLFSILGGMIGKTKKVH